MSINRFKSRITTYSNVKEAGHNVPSLKHFFRCLELSGQSWHDEAGGVVWTPSREGLSTAVNYAGSDGTLACLGAASTGTKPVELDSGKFHTFVGTKPILVVCAARKIIDPFATVPADPKRNYAVSRFALGDINNLGTVSGTTFAAPAGFGLAGIPFHAALGYNSTYAAANLGGAKELRLDCSTAYMQTAGDVPEPDPTNYPFPASTPFLTEADWKLNYEGYYPYRVSPAAKLVDRDILYIFVRDPTSNLYGYSLYDLNTNTRILYADTLQNAVDSLNIAVQPNACMRVANLAVYGYAAFEFDSLPSDWLIASKWMGSEWRIGRKYIWPDWIV